MIHLSLTLLNSTQSTQALQLSNLTPEGCEYCDSDFQN